MHPKGNIDKTFQTSQVFHKLVPNPSVSLNFLKKKIRCKTYKFCKHFTELLVSKNGCRVTSFHFQPRFSHTPHAVSQEAEKLALCLVRTLGSFGSHLHEIRGFFRPRKGVFPGNPAGFLRSRCCHHFWSFYRIFHTKVESSSYAKTLGGMRGCDPKVLGTPP